MNPRTGHIKLAARQPKRLGVKLSTIKPNANDRKENGANPRIGKDRNATAKIDSFAGDESIKQ